MLFKGNSSKLELLIEKIQSKKGEALEGSVGTNQASWDSNTPEQASPTSSSCPTPSSIVSDVTDAEVFTVGVTESTPHACKICNKAFAKTSQLTRHEQTHSDHLQYNCVYCPRLFKHKRSRDRHIKLHTGDKKYKCSFCDTAFSRSDHLKIHLKTHDNSKPFKCFLCNRGYNTAAALTSHQQSHIKQDKDKDQNSSESHACSYCPETFQKMELLQAHTSSHHLEPLTDNAQKDGNGDGTKWLCMYCAKDFLSLDELQQHVNNSHDVIIDSKGDDSSCKSSSQIIKQVQRVSYPCYNCTMQFYCLEKLRDHMARVHCGATTQQKILSNAVLKDCNICLPVSQNNSAPQPSLTQTSSDHSIQLLPTDLTWKRKAELSDENGHSKRFLQKADAVEGCDNDKCEWPIYICNICGTQLPNFSSFMLHMDNHIPGTDRNSTIFLDYCPLCGEPCRDQVEVNNHILVHAISLKLGKCCGICKTVFNYNSDELQRHMLDAHVSTTYKCSICEDTFDVKSEVLIHMTKKHSNECQHYRCKFCPDQTFHDRVDAEVHISQHAPNLLNTLCRNTNHLIYPTMNNSNNSGLQQKKSKTLQCPFCHKCFQTEQHQYLHIIREHKDIREMYRKRIFEINPDAQRQLQSTSPSISSLNPVTSSDLSTKYEVNHERYKCDICDCKDFINEGDLLAHKKLHQSKSKAISVSLHCAYCNELCKSRTDLENHTKSHQINSTKGKHKCNICDEIFQSGMTLAEHKLSHCKIVSGNSCTHCRTVLSDEQTFYNHQLQHSTVLNKQNSQMSLPANCIICCQTLQSEVEIKLHANFHLRHLLNKDLICSICKNSFSSANGPLISTANNDNTTIMYVCKECFSKNGTSSTSNSPLYPIIKYETDEKVTTCQHCHQVFQTEEKAMKHLASHGVFDTGSSYVCHLCRSFFPTSLKLQVHVIEHNFFGSGQFRCYICSTIFTTASGLLSHMIKHGSNAKPYECPQCQMKFFFQTELDNHRDDHLASIHHKNYQTISFSPNSNEPSELTSNKQQHCQCYEYPWSPSASEKHLQHCPLKITVKKEYRSSVSPKNELSLKKENGDASTSTPSDVER
ncbi:zinc finger protein 423 homolog isoform X2 [Agrilus planipennis]|uniref:Zinc finger protein 423 homolog isoform X2 n=1 Tax=Agrilus planipennis TaxID=224129 RepID=A0A7F5R094_AGRPL|nr:zinc finger protein 423 homolog isoform X2 [Agrilus planipennis]XP_025831036.1 zinc finger protein 423 homolog isoform X2 [Agrilus planipennis]